MFDNTNVYYYLNMVTKYAAFNKKTQIYWIINKTILLLGTVYFTQILGFISYLRLQILREIFIKRLPK